jgi:ferric-dicitrate binding protein FerR (iron transport regulator)
MTSMLRRAAIVGGVALLSAAAALAADVPTGVIANATFAKVDGSQAALGANVYSGDVLKTFENGSLRLRIGTGQVFMLASSDASLTQDHTRMDVLVSHGTAGFSGTAADPFEIETPVGMLRPGGNSHVFGQVTILGPKQVQISAYEGSLVLSRNGEERVIEAGKSYSVSLASSKAAPASASAAPSPQGGQGNGAGGGGGQWIFDAVVIGGAAVVGFVLWDVLSESASHP